jgi:hypothetical protein
MENYQIVKTCIEENECVLLTTFEEFEEMRKTVLYQYYQYVRVKLIGSCSHESSVVFTNFKLRMTGKRCITCIRNEQKETHKKNKNANEIEYEGIKILEEYLSVQYEVIRTKEGCLADVVIRKKGGQEDAWIPIQVKTTTHICYNMYSFNVHNEYKNMLIMCVCITERKIWVLPYNHLNVKKKLNISIKSKYSKYLIENDSIHTYIDQYQSEIVPMKLSDLLQPVNPLQQREQEYCRKRESNLPFLSYQYPDIQNTCVDVIVNGKKVQEKVLGFVESKKSLHCSFSANNCKLNGKRQFRCYQLGENDYYWIHSSIDDRFWIIPEQVLFEKGYISNNNEIKPRRMLMFKLKMNESHKWLMEYEFDYTNVNKDKIVKLFG